MARALLQEGADVNQVEDNGMTPLIYAAASGNLELVQLLLQSGADVSKEDGNGRTALDKATNNEREDVVKLLEEAHCVSPFLGGLVQQTHGGVKPISNMCNCM